jgi:hypothetical protein
LRVDERKRSLAKAARDDGKVVVGQVAKLRDMGMKIERKSQVAFGNLTYKKIKARLQIAVFDGDTRTGASKIASNTAPTLGFAILKLRPHPSAARR